MDDQSKHEIMVLALSTLAGVPVIGAIGFAVVTGILAF
jgi:preprotein translocase subunit Sss1